MSSRWLAFVVVAEVLWLSVAPPALADRSTRLCLKQCRRAKAECTRNAKAGFKTTRAACSDKACVSAAKAALPRAGSSNGAETPKRSGGVP